MANARVEVFKAWQRPLSLAVLVVIVAGALGIAFGLARFVATRDTALADRALITTIERTLSAIREIEASARGYVIVGEDDYLAPFQTAARVLDDSLSDLERAREVLGLPADSFERLAMLARARRDATAAVIDARRTGGFEAAATRVRSGEGKAVMDAVRAEAFRLEAEAAGRAAGAERRASRALLLSALAFLALALAGVGFFAWLSRLRRKEAEASDAALEHLLRAAPIGIGFVSPDGRLRLANPTLRSMADGVFGVPPGRPLWATRPDLESTLRPLIGEVAGTGESRSNVEVMTAPAGGALEERHLVLSAYPLSSDRRPQGVGLVATDATNRKRAERRLKESEERFRALTEATTAIIWRTNPSGAFVEPQAGWTAFTGQTFDALKDWGWLDAVHPDDQERTAEAWTAALDAKTLFSAEHRLRRADGAFRHMEVRALPILDDGGAVREWIGTHTDVTARRETERALEQARDAAEEANRAKSQFLANMSHELRTPLTAVIGYSEMLEEEVEDLGETSLLPDLRKINSNARHLLSLINDVLDLSKIEADRMEAHLETFDVKDTVEDVAATVEGLAARNGNALRVEVAEGVGAMRSDLVKVRQCLFNLLSNAAKFTERGTISLSVDRERGEHGDQVRFRVADTGIGMTDEERARLFERFVQADSSTTRRFGGTGLGLAISRAFIELLGGRIEVESEKGVGTVFTVVLPADSPESPPQAAAEEAGEAPEGVEERDLVLVIDDDPAMRELLTRFLLKEGFGVRAASDGSAGIALARELRPAAVLLDVAMPRVDGWSVLQAIKADPALANTAVVMVTSFGAEALGLSLGASDVVPKPVDWERLRRVLDDIRAKAAATDEADVLVIEDDPGMRGQLVGLLERDGWRVAAVPDGRAGLAHLETARPRLILLDLMMPRMDGFAFLREVNKRPDLRDIPIVVHSAKDIDRAERALIAAQAERIYTKGEISLRELAREIKELAPPPDAPAAEETRR